MKSTKNRKGIIMDDNVGVQLSDVRFVTPVCRMSYANILEPADVKDDNGNVIGKEYRVSLIFEPSADLSIMRKCLENAGIAKMGHSGIPKKIREYMTAGVTPDTDTRGYPIHPGDKKDEKDMDVYGGRLYVNVKNKRPPKFGEKINGKYVLTDDPEKARSGNYVRCSLTAFGYKNKKGGKGVSLGLNDIIFVRYGEELGTVTDPDSDFGTLGDSEVTSPISDGDFGGRTDNGVDDIPFSKSGPSRPPGHNMFT